MKLFNLKERKGFTLVELMIVVAIIGILAALAIPAFLRYIKQSKTAEAEQNMKKMAEGAKAYFTSEQRYVPTGGDQPWHGATTGSEAAGMPVIWDEYVFPGGASFAYCSHTGAESACSAYPEGGSKLVPGEPTTADGTAALNKMRVSFEDPTYFVYSYSTGASGGASAVATIIAQADFDTSSTSVHTVTSGVSIDAASQEPIIAPSYTTNEFE